MSTEAAANKDEDHLAKKRKLSSTSSSTKMAHEVLPLYDANTKSQFSAYKVR